MRTHILSNMSQLYNTNSKVQGTNQYQVHLQISQYCRSTERLWFEGILKIVLFQPPCHGKGCHPLDQVAKGDLSAGWHNWI